MFKMKIKAIFIASLLLLSTNISSDQFVDENVFIDFNECDQIIKHKKFSICYNYKHNSPIYVWYSLSKNTIDLKNIKERPKFEVDPNLPYTHQVFPDAYSETDYDRGHLANDASFDYNESVLKETYFTSNIVPQEKYINRVVWSKLEEFAREKTREFGSINVINIVSFETDDNSTNNETNRKITSPENNISQTIPTSFYKILYNNENDFIICFKVPNKEINRKYRNPINFVIKCNLTSRYRLAF